MYYRIGEVAKIIGTSKEAIRYFEKMDCINEPTRDSSGYREYDPLQMGMLRWFRLYRSYGYTMSEAASLIKANDFAEARPMLEEGLRRLGKNILELQKCEADLKHFLSEIYEPMKDSRKPCIETSPALHRISFEYMGKLFIDGKRGEAYRKWVERMPLVKYTQVFYREELEKGIVNMDSGVGIFQDDVLDWDPTETPHAEYYPPHMCVTCLVESPPLDYSSLLPIWNYMEENGLELDGDVYSRPAAYHKTDGVPYFTCKFYVPVCKTDKNKA